MDLMSIGSAILVFLTTVTLSIVAKEPIHYLLVRSLGGFVPRRERGVRGIWLSDYSVDLHGVVTHEKELLVLRQVGKHVIGRTLSGQLHVNALRGTIAMERYFTGTWESKVPSELYHGAFQCVLSLSGTEMTGKWIGFDSSNDVASGSWEWKLLSKKIDADSAKSEAVKFAQVGPDESRRKLTASSTLRIVPLHTSESARHQFDVA
jgi:hypothetical protein